MKRKISLALALIMLLSLLAGCGGGNTQTPNSGSESGETASGNVHRDTLTVGINMELDGTLPWSENNTANPPILSMIYETLITLDEEGNLVPCLATDWEMVDETHFRLKLREGVKFHNGNPFTADDVLFTFSQTNVAPATMGQIPEVDLENCEIENDYSLVVATVSPEPAFFTMLALTTVSQVDKESFEADSAAYEENPIGTGPFTWGEWASGDYIKLYANKDWWGGEISYDELMFRLVPDASTRAMEVQAGGLDLSVVEISDVEALQKNDQVVVFDGPRAQPIFMFWDCTKAPFDDINVRKAIKSAIDLDALADAVFFGMGARSYSPVPPQVEGYNEAVENDPYPYDVEAAKKYLAESDYPNGFETTIICRAGNGYDRAINLLQNYLGEIGIKAEIEVIDMASLSHRMDTGAFDMALSGWALLAMDAGPALTRFGSHNEDIKGTGNRGKYRNEELDQLLLAADAETDPEKRSELIKQAQQIIIDNVAEIELYLGMYFFAHDKSVTNVVYLPSGLIRYQDIQFSN